MTAKAAGAGVLWFVLVATGAGTASAADVDTYQSRGYSAYGTIYWGDECVTGNITVQASAEVMKSGPDRDTQSAAWLSFSSSDLCNGTTSWGSTYSSEPAFEGSLDSASLGALT